MKRLSLLALTMMLSLGCQGSDDKADAAQPTAFDRPTLGGSSPAPRLTSCYQADEWTCAVEAAIVAKTNEKRAGLAPLTQSFETSYVSRVHSQNQLDQNQISHNGFPDQRLATLESTFPGLSFFFTAENVAYMTSSEPDPEAVADALVTMWWNSSGHRTNMLGRHKYIGAGVVRANQQIYATQLFH